MDIGLFIIGAVLLLVVGYVCYRQGYSKAEDEYRLPATSGSGGSQEPGGGRAPIRE